MTDTPKLPPEGEDRPDADAYGREIPNGFGVNLLVADVERSALWQMAVLGAETLYWDRDFAILAAQGATWFLHQDRTYRNHPLLGIAQGSEGRGAGAELRLYGRDPDLAETAATAAGGIVLAGAADKPHGVREAHLIDPDGYCWVPTRSLR